MKKHQDKIPYFNENIQNCWPIGCLNLKLIVGKGFP